MTKSRIVPYYISSIFTSRLLMVFVLVFLVIALLNRHQEMSVLLLFIIFMNLFSYIWSKFVFLNLDVSFTTDKTHVFQGDNITIKLQVQNRKFLPVWVTSVPLFDETGFDTANLSNQTVCLLWFQQISFTHNVKAKKRGVFKIDYPNITASDLFGFYPRQRQISRPVEIIIFPRIAAIKPYLIPEQHFFGLPGTKSPVLDPVYILGAREYQYSTPAKMIHWKASARLDRLREKVCEPSVQGKTMVMVDVDHFKFNLVSESETGKNEIDFEHLLEAGAGLAVFFAKKGHRVGFLTNATIKGSDQYMVSCDTGSEAVSKTLELISRIEMKKRVQFNNLFLQHSGFLKGVSVALLCCDASNPSLVEFHNLCRLKKVRLKIIQSTPLKNDDGTVMMLSGNISEIGSVCL